MKRITSVAALLAFVTALTASVALAQQGTATKPAEPAKTETKTETKAEAKTESTMPAKHHHMAKASAKMEKVDLNTCSQEDLTKLGLSDEDAAKVISNRPYASKAQLKTKGGLNAKEYAKVSKHVWAKQAKAEKAEKTETAK